MASGLWRAVVTTAVDREARGSAQDRAHIVWIGDLIEHEHDAGRFDLVDFKRGQGVGFRQQTVMHGVGAEAGGDRTGPHQFGWHR